MSAACSTGIAEGLLHRLRKFREAWAYLPPRVEPRVDGSESLAALHHAIGHCSVDLGDFDVAEQTSTAPSRCSRNWGSRPGAQSELGRGRMFIRSRRVDRGIAHLRTIRVQFLRADWSKKPACAGWRSSKVCSARRCIEAVSLARQIIASSPQRRSASARSAPWIPRGGNRAAPTSATVAHVRDYIVSLRTSPEREFTIAG
jgi:hypothetical protein